MNCPFCGHEESKVIDSRESPDGIRRRRECMRCELRFTTYERVHSTPLMVAKRDGRREPFSREKLERSLRLACAKRPLEAGAVSKLAVDIENELQRLGRAETESKLIGEMAMERLRTLDRVAYIRFASVYRDFQDADSFAREVQALHSADAQAKAGSSQLALIPEGVADATGTRQTGGPPVTRPAKASTTTTK
jgi:transcriptional repressor NrdR